MVTGKGKAFYLNLFATAAAVLMITPLFFMDQIEGWFAEDRANLVPVLSLQTRQSNWDLHLCITEIRVSGLGLQNRRGPRKFLWTDPEGTERRVSSYANAARDTRLDIVKYDDYKSVQFFSPTGRGLRPGEKRHLAECLGLKELPAS